MNIEEQFTPPPELIQAMTELLRKHGPFKVATATSSGCCGMAVEQRTCKKSWIKASTQFNATGLALFRKNLGINNQPIQPPLTLT